MSEVLKKLANDAIELQKKIKSDTLKLQEIKKQLIELSKNKNNSYAINLPFGKIKIWTKFDDFGGNLKEIVRI